MSQIIPRLPNQVFIGLATRKADGTLNHQGFTRMDSVPEIGDTVNNREVAEVLTDVDLLTEMTRLGRVDKMDAVAVLGKPKT